MKITLEEARTAEGQGSKLGGVIRFLRKSYNYVSNNMITEYRNRINKTKQKMDDSIMVLYEYIIP